METSSTAAVPAGRTGFTSGLGTVTSPGRRTKAVVELPLYYAISWFHTGIVLLSIAAFAIVYVLRLRIFGYSPFPSSYHGDFWQTATVCAMIFSVGMFCQTLRFYDRGLLFMGRAALFMALLIMTLKCHDFMNLVARPIQPDMLLHHNIMARGRPISDERTYLRDISFDGINISYELTAGQFQAQQTNKDANDGRYRLMLPATGRASGGIASLSGPNQGKAGSTDYVPE